MGDRFSRLRSLSIAEIGGRLRYEVTTGVERARYRAGCLAGRDRLRAALRRDLRSSSRWSEALLDSRRRSPAFSAGLAHRGALRRAFAGRFRAEHVAMHGRAKRVLAHEIDFFGETFRYGPKIPWHTDPVTGALWPIVYHRDVPVHEGNQGYGDVKYVWEVNRQQYLIDLAKTAFVNGERGAAEEVTRLVCDWLAKVPYATGVPWANPLEPAFRVWSWLWAYDMLRQADLLEDDAHHKWLQGFWDHGRFLFQHLECYSSPYNHLIGEASALYALGVLFPEFRHAGAWRCAGLRVLEETAGSQFHEDGASVEQSSFYHHATLGFYLLAMIIGERGGGELSKHTRQVIERALEFSMALTLPDGKVPAIGGADDGKPIRFEHLPFWDFRPYLAIGAVLYSRTDFKHVAGRFWEDAVWLLGPEGMAAFDRLPARAPATTSAFPDSGYGIARSSWSGSADYLCMDCGPQAGGLRRDGISSAAHGHADCLSIVVALGGRRVVVDPGFFCYNGDPEWEVHFRRTVAHSTATIDGRDQSRHVTKMRWSHVFEPRWEGWRSSASIAWLRGSHDGYAREATAVRHRRAAWLRDGGYVLVYDEFTGTGDHSVLVNFQCAPGELSLDGRRQAALLDGRFEFAWCGSTAVGAESVCGGSAPTGGWIAESLGILRAAPRLTLTLALEEGRAALLTVLSDRQVTHGAVRAMLEASPNGLELQARVRGAGWEDAIVAGDDQRHPTSWGETDAAVAVARLRAGSPVDAQRLGGTYLRVRGQDGRYGADDDRLPHLVTASERVT